MKTSRDVERTIRQRRKTVIWCERPCWSPLPGQTRAPRTYHGNDSGMRGVASGEAKPTLCVLDATSPASSCADRLLDVTSLLPSVSGTGHWASAHGRLFSPRAAMGTSHRLSGFNERN